MNLLYILTILFIFEDPVLSKIKDRAIEKGIPESYLNNTFNSTEIKTHDKIIDLFARPYEKKSWGEYQKLFVTKSRIDKGKLFYTKNYKNLSQISKSMKVDIFIILSIVGIESNYGLNKGKYNVFNALYTQAIKMPTRSKWAEKELIEFLDYCYNDNISPHSIKGSYAGAFGYGQFIPSSFNNYSKDGNGDKHRKPYDWPDVFASIANYLLKNGYPIKNKDTNKIYKSIYAYNHSDNYVKAVLGLSSALKNELLNK